MTVSPALAAKFEQLRQILAAKNGSEPTTEPFTVALPTPEPAGVALPPLQKKALARNARLGRKTPPSYTITPITVDINPPESLTDLLTACMDTAPCRESAKRIYKTLFLLALEVSRYQGHPTERITRAVFHLPAELLMAYIGLGRTAFYENLGFLHRLGLVASDAHIGTLRGQRVATGTLWVVSLRPESVLAGRANPARLLHDDWQREWRNLDRDVKEGRTVYNVLKPTEQSIESKKEEIDLKTLKDWVLIPFKVSSPVTVTVRLGVDAALDSIWEIQSISGLPKAQRAERVDDLARRLVQSMGDSKESLNFWRWLIWQVVRAADAGQNLATSVSTVLAAVLRDLSHDESIHGKSTVKRVAAVAVASLRKSGLYDLLRGVPLTRVGTPPQMDYAGC